jgi:hypothetical protein
LIFRRWPVERFFTVFRSLFCVRSDFLWKKCSPCQLRRNEASFSSNAFQIHKIYSRLRASWLKRNLLAIKYSW